ncbi:MAG: altronate dehydratase [Bacteroidales bacterium]|nr:altronate dehydratase [Bacteroidales bacterium]
MTHSISLNRHDNVGVALSHLKAQSPFSINGHNGTVIEAIKEKHKFALKDIDRGEKIIMYGIVVGEAIIDIKKGSVISTKNIVNATANYQSSKGGEGVFLWTPVNVEKFKNLKFNGYHRDDGQIGTENNWIVFSMVFCENRNVLTLKNAFERALGYEQNIYEDLVKKLIRQYQNNEKTDHINLIEKETSEQRRNDIFKNVQVKFITHHAGCGGTRQDSDTLCRLLAGYLKNPNVAGATILSLGCQNAEVECLKNAIADIGGIGNKPLLFLDHQEIGTESKMIELAINGTFKGLLEADKHRRKAASISDLIIGLECGASDGFSGISANPVLGHLSDLVVALGGKVILGEFPELGGVEQEIIDRTPIKSHADKFISLMKDYAAAAQRVGSGFDMNPSPGNIKDGLITDAMKSAGAARKGGSSPIKDVLDYTEYIKESGLNLLCTPGNDVESTTALVGSGANMVLFTTGLGTPTGNPIAPVVKVSSNTKLYQKMPDIIDFNTGEIIDGGKTIEELAEELLIEVIKIASGDITSKASLLGQNDFIPWKRGVSL